MRRRSIVQGAGIVVGASLAAATLGVAPGAAAFSGNPHYYDISNLTPLAQRAAVRLYREGIMNGTAPGKFAPYIRITRAQAVKFVVNALGLPLDGGGAQTYTDVSPASQYFGHIEAAVKANILSGMAASSGDFHPSTPITRVDFAVLATNALGDQSLAQSLQGNTTKYGYLTDLASVPAADLGDVNAMMEAGIVPPYDKTRFAPFVALNREEFAVALMRLDNVLTLRSPASVSLSAAQSATTVGKSDQLSLAVTDENGHALPTSALSAYDVTYAVTSSNSSTATVTSTGAFSASAAGTYTVQVQIDGGRMVHPITATTTIQVNG